MCIRDRREGFHFKDMPSDALCARVTKDVDVLVNARIKANCEALSILRSGNEVVPVGMSIGPFSLLIKLVSDPITAVYMAGTGVEAEDDEEVDWLHAALKLSETIIQATCAAKIKACHLYTSRCV